MTPPPFMRPRQVPLRGRDDVVKALVDLVRSAVAGHGAARTLVGEAGIGKTSVIDEVVRGQRSEAADEEWVEERAGNPQRAEGTMRTSDEAEHLMENIEADQFGTPDPQEATERGTAYEPPVRPVQEGSTREQH